MTVAELIKILQKCPQAAPVVFAGDGGPTYVGEVGTVSMGGHDRMDDTKCGRFVTIATVKKHKAICLRGVFWDELAESGAVKWHKVDESILDAPHLYRKLREECSR